MIRVLVADDNAVIRSGLVALLATAGDIDVVAEAGNGAEAIARAGAVAPDVCLLDVRMPGTDGVAAAATLSRSAKVMMLTYTDDEPVVTAAIRAGASGYLVHGRFEPHELFDGVRRLAAGEPVLSPAVAGVVLHALRTAPDATAVAPVDGSALTEREHDIARLVSRGWSNGEIAADLHLSEKTVKNHLTRIYAKLGVRTRAEAVAAWLGADGRPFGG